MAVTAGMDIHPVYLRRLSGRLREQARSHSWIAVCQVGRRRLGGRHRRQASSHRRHLQPTDSALCCMNSEDAHPAQTTQSLRRNKPQSRVDGGIIRREATLVLQTILNKCAHSVCVWRGSLLPLGCEAPPSAAAAQPNGSKLPRHRLRVCLTQPLRNFVFDQQPLLLQVLHLFIAGTGFFRF